MSGESTASQLSPRYILKMTNPIYLVNPLPKQVLCSSISYSKPRAALIMDLRAYGGKEYIFELDQGLVDRTAFEGSIKPINLVASHYLLLSCYPEECEDWRWRINVDVMCSATGMEYKAHVRPGQWACLGLGDWESLCALERQFLVRQVCTNMHLLRSNDTHYLECKLGNHEEIASTTVAKTPIKLFPVDTNFVLSTLPEHLLLFRETVEIQGKQYIVSFSLARKLLAIKVVHQDRGTTVMVAHVKAEDYLYWWCNAIPDIVQVCQWISRRLLFIITPTGEPSLQLPVTTITPVLRFSFENWHGESRGFHVKVYAAGDRLLVVAEDRTGEHGLHFAVVRSEQYELWDIGDIGNLNTDTTAQSTVIIHLKSLMLINDGSSSEARSIFLSLTPDSIPIQEGEEDPCCDFQATTDGSLSYRYMGLLMDNRHNTGC